MNPVWVKIADFGVSKCTKRTILRTRVHSQGYAPPEMLGLLGSEHPTYSTGIDIWALGCILHEMLTGEIPFLDSTPQYFDSDLSLESRADSELTAEVDIAALKDFCDGKVFPNHGLRRAGVSAAAEECVKSMLVVIPEARVTAQNALLGEWLRPATEDGEEAELRAEQQARRKHMSVLSHSRRR